MWDYAQLTKTAAEYGGPEKLIEKIEAAAFMKGSISGLKQGVGIAALISMPVCVAVAKAYAGYQLKKEEANRAKQTLSNYLQMEEKLDASWEKHHGQI